MSWLSSLASFIPVVGPAIGAGLSFLTGSGGGGNSAPPDPLSNPTVQSLLKGLNTPATMDPATKGSMNFYQTALNGGQDATRTLLGPDVSTVLSQYDNASRAAAELGPRGGGRTAIEAEAPFLKAGAYGKLLAGVKSNAVQGLSQIGGQQTAAATARRGQNVSVLGSVLNGQSDQAKLAYEAQKDRNAQYNQLGGGIGSILTNLLSKKGSGGGGVNSPTFGDYSIPGE